MPVATALAEPPLEPPVTRVSSSGWRVAPKPESSLVVPKANSWRLVLPTSTAPAWRRRVVTVASAAATPAHAHARTGRRDDAGFVDEVLERDRNAVQRASAVPGRSAPDRRLMRGRQRSIAGDGDEGVQPRVQRRDALETPLGERHRGGLAARQRRRELADGLALPVGHGRAAPRGASVRGRVCHVVPVGSPQRRGGGRQPLQQRLQLRQPAPIRIRLGRRQPAFAIAGDVRHDRSRRP